MFMETSGDNQERIVRQPAPEFKRRGSSNGGETLKG